MAKRIAYNDWANATLYRDLKSKRAPERALRAFQHLLETELTWSNRILGLGNPTLKLWEPVPAETRDEWFATTRRQLQQIARNEAADDFSRSYTYQNYAGQPFQDTVADTLEQVLTHSAHYRGEAAGLSNAAGVQMPDLDYIFWQRAGEPGVGE
jgi:uncharacterized damage-inducible protein DinB